MLLLLVSIAALGIWRYDRARRQARAVAQIEKYGGHIGFDNQVVNNGLNVGAQPRGLKWLRRTLGDDYFRNVTHVTYDNLPPSDATLAPLADLDRVEVLAFVRNSANTVAVAKPPGFNRLTESGLAGLERLMHLRRLELEQVVPIGSMLHRLNHSPRLEELSISEWGLADGGITDEDLSLLSTMPRLRTLSFGGCRRITGSGLGQLRGSTSLEALTLAGCRLSDVGFKYIGTLHQLKVFYFNFRELSDGNLADLENLTGLTSLTLHSVGEGSRFTDAGLVHLRGMTRLQKLDLNMCPLTGRGLAALKHFDQLVSLNLACTAINDSGLEVIAGFPNLKELNLDATDVRGGGLSHLSGLKKLRTLSVHLASPTPQSVDALKAAIPTLTVYP